MTTTAAPAEFLGHPKGLYVCFLTEMWEPVLGDGPDRAERMAALMDAFAGCMDDATELMELGRMKQQDILKGVQFLQGKSKEFLAELERQIAAAPASAAYKENLEFAHLAVKEALEEAEKATKEISPGPVRRKQ